MSEVLNSTGGANQTVKAVLEALGKNYIVEKWINEDGTQKYQRWADGKIEVFMRITQTASSECFITFPIAFQTPPVVSVSHCESSTSYYIGPAFHDVTETECDVVFTGVSGDQYTVTELGIYAVGY